MGVTVLAGEVENTIWPLVSYYCSSVYNSGEALTRDMLNLYLPKRKISIQTPPSVNMLPQQFPNGI